MNPQRWQRVRTLFARAVALAAADRHRLLELEAADDTELRREVEELIAADGGDDRIAAAVQGGAAMATRMPRDEAVGPWKIQRQLGEGGMGAVYLAVRADGSFQKRVAVKLLKRGMDSEAILRRFELERHILAGLEHPNIARLLDAGSTGDGRPYFVMEYVDGVPIDTFCDERRLGVEARLELFRAVCSAVSYLHQNLIVHRDLKPSNILITAAGVPKLLDFGIAKLLNPPPGSDSLDVTCATLRPMTPGYASPEQAAGRPVTTASDVYSLGVALYGLLCGRRPHRSGGAGGAGLEQALTEGTPPPPSAALRRAADAEDPPAAELARCRGSDAPSLERRLRGDLDTIVATALRREPQRRYPTANDLAEDLRRHLAGLPVAARGEGFGYRAGKFLRRHTWGVAAAAAALLATTALVLTLGVLSLRLTRERDLAERERLRAEQVSDFLVELFEVTDPRRAQGTMLTARELLDNGADRIRGELAEQPEIQAKLMDTIGRVYQQLGLYKSADPLFEQALALRRRVKPGADAEVAASLNGLAVQRAETGDYEAAEPLFREALEMRRELFGPRHERIAASLNNLALLLHDRGDLATAEPLYREALAMDIALAGTGSLYAVDDRANLALLLHDRGAFAEAERLHRDSLEARQRELGPQHPDVASSLTLHAMTLTALGRLKEAETELARALEISGEVLDADHPERARTLYALAELRRRGGDPEAAEELHREALEMRRRLLGEEHPEVAMSVAGLAQALADRGEGESARELFQRAIAMQRRGLRPGHPLAAPALIGLGRLLLEGRDPAGAEPYLAEALGVYRRLLPAADPRIASAETLLASCRPGGEPPHASPFGVVPRLADSDVDHQRYRELRHAPHFGPHQLAQVLDLPLGSFEDQLVVHRQQQPRRR